MAEIDPRLKSQIKGSDYAGYDAALDAATRMGLTSLTTKLIQAPTAENEFLAVVEATAIFGAAEPVRVFSDLGEAAAATEKEQFRGALIRLASTRSKRRALCDACNIGEAMLGDEEEGRSAGHSRPMHGGQSDEALPCAVCNVALTKGQREVSLRAFGKPLCPAHQRDQAASSPPPTAPAPVPDPQSAAPPGEERKKLLAFWTQVQSEAKALKLSPPVLAVQSMSDHDLAAVVKEWNGKVEAVRRQIAARPAA